MPLLAVSMFCLVIAIKAIVMFLPLSV